MTRAETDLVGDPRVLARAAPHRHDWRENGIWVRLERAYRFPIDWDAPVLATARDVYIELDPTPHGMTTDFWLGSVRRADGAIVFNMFTLPGDPFGLRAGECPRRKAGAPA